MKLDKYERREDQIDINKITFAFNKEEDCYFMVNDSTLKIVNYLDGSGNILNLYLEGYVISLNVDTLDITIDINKSTNQNDLLNSGQIRCIYAETLEEWSFNCASVKAVPGFEASHFILSCYETRRGFMPESWNPFKCE